MRILAALAVLAGLLAGTSPAAAQNRFWLQNNTGQAIVAANVSPSRVQDWGPNILSRGPVGPGMQVWVEPTFADCYLDIRVRFADGTEDGHLGVHACTLTRIVFGPDVSAPTPAPAPPPPRQAEAPNPSFTFVNRTGEPIREIYVSLTSERNWGRDRLGARQILPSGAAMPITLPRTGVCTADMRIVFMDGRIMEQRNVETCSIREYVWR
ncbi:Tat pathway signal protein [Neoroseomonas oryzicola]|uniref:Tat pathway signal protein n=1 Tax=Neoroseomonas oryzicola TaxID=535904 RepID=A0A9X9WGX6_9PROT|nr:Tat pathway signal protein [Neoroseomonas oryzicola]MBR0659586.1 Tat pathway signal protein [Neoroseomonas oryzicola]NKE16135.1 Tat pathway signal protein [Neoroseomonas oryzicola]